MAGTFKHYCENLNQSDVGRLPRWHLADYMGTLVRLGVHGQRNTTVPRARLFLARRQAAKACLQSADYERGTGRAGQCAFVVVALAMTSKGSLLLARAVSCFEARVVNQIHKRILAKKRAIPGLLSSLSACAYFRDLVFDRAKRKLASMSPSQS